MKNIKKLFILIVIAITSVCIFTACSSKDDNDTTEITEVNQNNDTAVSSIQGGTTFKDFSVIYDMFVKMSADVSIGLYETDESGDLAQAVYFGAVAMTLNNPYNQIIVQHPSEDTWSTPKERDFVDLGDQEISVTKNGDVYVYTENHYYDEGTTCTITLTFNPQNMSADYVVVTDTTHTSPCHIQYTLQNGILYVVESRLLNYSGGLRNIVACYDGTTSKYAGVQTSVQSDPTLPVEIYNTSNLSWDMLYSSYDFSDVYFEYNNSTQEGTYNLPNN